ncbi:Protein PPP5D1 [Plecturocebus cupreus]
MQSQVSASLMYLGRRELKEYLLLLQRRTVMAKGEDARIGEIDFVSPPLSDSVNNHQTKGSRRQQKSNISNEESEDLSQTKGNPSGGEERRQGLTLSLRLECCGMIIAHWSFKLLGSSNPPTSASQVAGAISPRHHTQLILKLFLYEVSLCCPGSSLTLGLKPNSPTSASKGLYYTWLNFLMGHALSPKLECSGAITAHSSLDLLGSKMWSHCVAQAGLKHLGSSNPPTVASQSVGITGMNQESFREAILNQPVLYKPLYTNQKLHPIVSETGRFPAEEPHGRQRDSFGRRGCFAGAPARRFPVRSIRDGRAQLVPSTQGKQQLEALMTESFTASTANPGRSGSVGKGRPPKEN